MYFIVYIGNRAEKRLICKGSIRYIDDTLKLRGFYADEKGRSTGKEAKLDPSRIYKDFACGEKEAALCAFDSAPETSEIKKIDMTVTRACMCCDKIFKSQGKGNRLCKACNKESASWEEMYI